MADINFTDDEKAIIVHKVQLYFAKELNQEIGRFDAEFLIDFFSSEVGAYFYNRGLYDAQALISSKVDDLTESIYLLERSTDYRK